MLFPSESPPSLSFVSLPCGSSPPLCWRVLGRTGKQGLVCGFSGLRQAFRVGAVSRLSASASISPLARSSSLPLHHFNVQVRIQEIPQDVRTPSKAESDVEGGLGSEQKAWDWGGRRRGRERREASEPKETLAENVSAPSTASNRQDLHGPQILPSCFYFTVDKPARFCLRRRLEHSYSPQTACCSRALAERCGQGK